MPGGARRDPVSETFDRSAARILERAYAKRGQWIEIWLPDPTIRQRSRWVNQGINVDGPDNPSVRGRGRGGVDAKTRWGRAFVRSVYYLHKASGHSGAVRVQVGRHVAASPQFDPAHPERGGLPPRRRVRVQLAAGGKRADAAVRRLGDRDRIWTDDGREAARFSDPALRDWA